MKKRTVKRTKKQAPKRKQGKQPLFTPRLKTLIFILILTIIAYIATLLLENRQVPSNMDIGNKINLPEITVQTM